MAMPPGAPPTGIEVSTVSLATSMTLTVSAHCWPVTARVPVRSMAIGTGPFPTVRLVMRVCVARSQTSTSSTLWSVT
jgi:hypothetical protein